MEVLGWRYAEVVVLEGFSAHADQRDLLAFTEAVHQRGRPRQIALVHGERPAQQVLAALLTHRGFTSVSSPGPHDTLTL